MRASDALRELDQQVAAARALIAASDFAAVGKLCNDLIWVPQFEGTAELIAMMLLEEHPDSAEARAVVAHVLITLGRSDAATQVSAGASLPGVDEDDERGLDRLAERTRLAFEAVTRK